MKRGHSSSTARLITEGLLLIAREYADGKLVSEEGDRMNEQFARSWGRGALFFKLLSMSWFRRVLFAIERMVIPGLTLHYAVRKQYIEDTAVKAIEAGARQVVVLGGGFDTLAIRLGAQHSDVRFVEVDHPDTQSQKLRALAGFVPVPPNLHFHPADLLGSNIGTIFNQAGCDPQTPAFIIAEGLLMYFPRERVEQMLREIAGYFPAGSSMVFSFMEKQPGGEVGFHSTLWLVGLWLRWKNEPFQWGMEKTRLPELAESLGWSFVEQADEPVFRDRLLTGRCLQHAALAKGEVFCLVEKRLEKALHTPPGDV